jgi:LPXTG-site transpeptidase (sortase) family protein
MKRDSYIFKWQKRILIAWVMIALLIAPGSKAVQAAEHGPLIRRSAQTGQVSKLYHQSASSQTAQTSGLNQSRLGAVAQAVLASPDPTALDEFGWSVAVSGNTAVVGARNEDPDLGGGPISQAGAAYVYVRSGTGWILEAKLVPRDAKPGDTFGVSVAIEGNTAVVGASGRDVGDDENAGAAFVFVRQGIEWKQKAELVAKDNFEQDGFGVAVAIDGSTLVIGADAKDVGPLPDAGAAYVFIRQGGSWDQKAKLVASDAYLGEFFGGAVDVSGNRIIVGATQADPYDVTGPGQAYIFEGQGNSWKEKAILSPDEDRLGDFFGSSVAISGGTAVVGAKFHDPNLGSGRITNGGAAYVFTRETDGWNQRATLYPLDAVPFAEFGHSVAIEGNKIAVGAKGMTQAGYTQAGAVYLFAQLNKEWVQQTKVVPDYIYENDAFGRSVAMSGDRLVIGATGRDPGNIAQAGEAFVFLLGQVQLPETGFAPGKITLLKPQPPTKAYSAFGDLWLEIPAIGVETSIVGVAEGGSGWDTTWLWDQAGYLEGTAFPTWPGNTAIAAHAALPNGQPGPFARLDTLSWGDRLIIHAWGQRYTYEVRKVTQTRPENLKIISHEEYSWITLITCGDYDEKSEKYINRTIARAVLISVEDE